MRKKVILITGASGEIGQALVQGLCDQNDLPIITLDIAPTSEAAHPNVLHLQGDILEKALAKSEYPQMKDQIRQLIKDLEKK